MQRVQGTFGMMGSLGSSGSEAWSARVPKSLRAALGTVCILRQPYEECSDRDHREEVRRELLEAHGDAPVSFDLLEESLDERSFLVEVPIDWARGGALEPVSRLRSPGFRSVRRPPSSPYRR